MGCKLAFFILVFICQKLITTGEDTIPSVHAGFQAHYGFIIPHSKVIESVSHTNPYGFEISLNKLHTTFKQWQVFNAYWISGLQTGYFNFQNPDILGSVYDITIFAEPVVSHRRNYLFSICGGTGLSYHTRFYDKLENPLNQFFSTRLAFPLFVGLRLKYRLAERTYFTISGYYNHISNGGLKQPNKGMNFPTLALGLEHFHSNVPELNHNYTSGQVVPKPGISLLIQTLSAIKILEGTEVFPEKLVFIYGFQIKVSKQIKSYYALNLGSEMVFDDYIKETIKREQTGLDHKRFALTAGQDFLLGKVIFTQNLGFYIYSPYKARNPVYEKYELAYKFSPKLIAGVYLKAHMQVAEMMGLSFSYRLFYK
ncbi:MAG: acyloxyacyl hydrolase [Bacteroidales bacterium]|nr:acyloxyacyl hydrolase [Bacteroidales bacterium]